ncbi:MAG: tetratricopeptide repeat protein [Flavobacteriales bacterium]|nr:tetratricopeptide repeat protein [Flavobacteriales bacterium]
MAGFGSVSDSLIRVAKKGETSHEQLRRIAAYCIDYMWTEPHVSDTLIEVLGQWAEDGESDFYLARAHFFRGMRNYKKQQFHEAMDAYIQSRKLLESLDSTKELAEVYHNIGLVYRALGELDPAREYYNKALSINEKHNYTEQLIKNKLVLAALISNIPEQIAAFREIGKISEMRSYTEGQFIAGINVATLLNNSGKPDSALLALQEAELLLEETGNDKYIHNIYQLMGLIYKRQGNYREAIAYLNKALKVNVEKNEMGRVLELYLNLAGTYREMGAYDTAYDYLDKHRVLNYEIDFKKNSESIAQLEADYQVELQKKENALLRKKAETSRRQGILLVLLLLTTLIAISLLTARYITRQKHITELEGINTQLNTLNHEMENVLQVVSHDFRTPLAKIKMLTELIQSQEPDASENLLSKLEKIGRSVAEAENLVNDILEIRSFNKEGEHLSNPEAFSIVQMIESILAQYADPIELKQLSVRYEHQGDEAIIQEPEIVKRIAINLISNAIKFSYANKPIDIRTEHKDNTLKLIVRDQGPGFSETDREKLFHKFGKYSNKPIQWGTSHGLGLYIVHKLTERLRGTISLNSAEGNGAEFTLSIDAVVE